MNDDEIDALLSPHKLSGHEHEQIHDEVLRRVGKSTAPSPSRWRWLAPPLALAAGLVLYVATRPTAIPYVGTRGGPTRRGPGIEVACASAELTRCPTGSRLLFQISRLDQPGYLSAYAESRSDRQRIWYFSAEGETPLVAPAATPASSGEQPLKRGIQLGPEHPAGTYDVHVLITHRPLTQAEAIAPNPSDLLFATTVPLTVVP